MEIVISQSSNLTHGIFDESSDQLVSEIVGFETREFTARD